METNKLKPRIGKKLEWMLLFWGLILPDVWAQSPSIQFSATTDSRSISINDSLVLTLSVKSEGDTGAGEPSFDAPDFDIGQQSNSMSMSAHFDYNTSQMVSVTERAVQVLLRPKRQGQVKISHIQMKSGNQIFKAPDIFVMVGASGQSSKSAQGYPQGQLTFRGRGLRPRDPRARDIRSSVGSKIFVRAEVDRTTAYKGQKVLVSYYIYHQPRISSVQIEQFPTLTGFLREDLSPMALGQALESQEVKFNGEVFERSLLARYAAYPVTEGQLTVEPVAVKYVYLEGRRRNSLGWGEDEDPFFGFFSQPIEKMGKGKSEPLTVTVVPIPQEGRPTDFSGGVGQFNLISMVDKYEVRANEAMTLTLKVEGNGNLSSLQAPQGKWPSQVELYDTHGRSLPSQGDSGAKVFEFLLIPRSPGQLVLPSLQLTFFDPDKKSYYTKTTEPIEVRVLDPLPGSASLPPKASEVKASAANPSEQVDQTSGMGNLGGKKEQLRGWLPPERHSADSVPLPVWRYLYWASLLALVYFAGWVVWDLVQRKSNASSLVFKEWSKLQNLGSDEIAKANYPELVRYYEILSDALLQTVDEVYATSARATSRSDLQGILLAMPGFSQELWVRLSRVLDFADLVRFAGQSGAVNDFKAQQDLIKLVSEVQVLMKEMRANPKRKGSFRVLNEA